MRLNPDFRDLLAAFADARVSYLVVGGYAVAFHGRPRSTKDIDLWVDGSAENLARVADALSAFGAPVAIVEHVRTMGPDEIVYMGSPPLRVDILRSIDGVVFADAYQRRVEATWDDVPVAVIASTDLVANKRAAGREQDLRDAALLERIAKGSRSAPR